jgi:hypothetical protein
MITSNRRMALGCRSVLLFLSLAVVMMWTASAVAQLTTARLSGSVVDTTGSVVPGATVTVKQAATGYKQTATAGSGGDYLFPSLPVGSYQLTVEMTGFAPYEQNGIVLAVGQAATENVALTVGSVSQQVTVEANASMVTTQDATVGQLINETSMTGLPLNGRDAQQLVFLVPGTVNVSSQNCGSNCEGGVLPGEQYAKVNGGGANGVAYLLDGVDYNDTYINTNLPFPSPDALQEFNVQTDNMNAAYGNATGGVVNIVTKSGTDKIHGDAFEFLRNYAMDARNYFATSPNPLKQNQFGGTIGGPILKGKLFYFGSYQGTRTNTAANGQRAFVPTAAERQGDFSADLPGTQLINPATGQPFPGNQIPSGDLNPVAQYLLQHIPLPNGPGNQLTYNGLATIANTDEFLAKADYELGKHHLSGHYFQMNYRVPTILPPTANVLAGNTGYPQDLKLRHVSVVDIFTISPNFLLSSYFGYTSTPSRTIPSDNPFNIAQAGSQIAQPTGIQAPAPLDVSVGNDFAITGLDGGSWGRNDQSLREIATLIKGKNEFQLGGEARRAQVNISQGYLANGNFSFSNSLSGDNIADFILGDVSTFKQGADKSFKFTGIDWSAFVQDDVHLIPRLTVSAGLRWDPYIPYKEADGRVSCFVPGAQSVRFPNAPTGLIFGGSNHDAGCSQSSIDNNLGNLGPRIGFALQLTKDGNTSLRGGAGYYYQTVNTVALGDASGAPFTPRVTLTDVNFTDPYQSAGVASIVPPFGPIVPGPSATFSPDLLLTTFSRTFRLPQIATWNLTLERGIGAGWLVRVGYMGSRGTHLSGSGDQESGYLELNPAAYIPGQSTEANTQQRRIYPDFSDILEEDSSINSNYSALELTVEKRVSEGFSFLVNYTWARSLNDFAPNGEPGGEGSNTCSCGRNFDYGPDAGDVNKLLRISGNYALPRAPFKGVADKLINGWSLTGIENWQTGFPFTLFSQDDNSFSAIGADRADLTVPKVQDAILSTGRSHAQMIKEWFNTADFGPNPVGTFGNTGKNILRGPRYFDADLALLKSAKINDRVSLAFRAEFYNALNNVNFNMPDGGVTDSNFGQITSAMDPRILQMGLKASF